VACELNEPAFALVVYLQLIGEPGGECTHLRCRPQRDRPDTRMTA